MPELILSDITVMGQGYCVIGLEEVAPGLYRSVRPMPPWGFAWREPFPFKRGDGVKFRSRPLVPAPPHVEDCPSFGLFGTRPSFTETQLIPCLKKAETSEGLEHLFNCPVRSSGHGGHALWVDPAEATRSICGCEYENLRFRLYPEPQGFTLRVEVILGSGERVSSIPMVDREWRNFASHLVQRIHRADPLPLAERLLNRAVAREMLLAPGRFLRIGLPRPKGKAQCWLMLDSLFPQPQESWLDAL